MSLRAKVVYGVEIRGQPCAYCGQPAVNGDHVIPRSTVRHYNASDATESIPSAWLAVVPSCFACNIRKGTRRLVPPSWAKRVKAMNRFFGGTKWRVWQGDTSEVAYAGTHLKYGVGV
ncbi:MAG: hypothetical protein GEU71_18110 [Actinobacteria bacterium]|nr:hypothetical protein [Actinomycetota bacterium]